MVNFKTKSKVIVAVSGDTIEYTPFCVDEKQLFSDSLHLTDSNNFTDGAAMIPIGKLLKDNSEDLPGLPDEFSTDSKVKKLRIIAFPLILPIVKGFDISEGDIGDNDVYGKFDKVHDLYADWVYLYIKKYVLGEEFFVGDKKCPMPEKTCDQFCYVVEFPLKVLFKTKNDSTPYGIIKGEVAKFILQNKPEEESSIPHEVNLLGDKTIVSLAERTTSTSSTSSSANVKNERLSALLAILSSKPLFDRKGDLASLIPAVLTNEIQEIISSSASTSEQARALSDSIEALADDVSRERSYLSRASKFHFYLQL